jgi:hypothetical protein
MDRLPLVVRVAIPVAVALAGCSGDEEINSTDAYCQLVDNHLPELTSPSIVDQGDVSAAVTLYRQLADAAPLAIEPEWRVMLASIETAAAADPDDPPSVEDAADAARESQVAANAVLAYTQQHCGLSLGVPGNTTVPPPPETPPPT